MYTQTCTICNTKFTVDDSNPNVHYGTPPTICFRCESAQRRDALKKIKPNPSSGPRCCVCNIIDMSVIGKISSNDPYHVCHECYNKDERDANEQSN